MKGSFKKLVSRIAKGQGGFTLIEMIVVVGIIAVLAAVIVPNIGKFIGSGEAGAMDAEQESVQTAMNAMMAEQSITSVTVSTAGSPGTNAWSALPVGAGTATLDGYLQSATTIYYYCYGADGQVVSQSKAGAVANC
jgi:type IV pilus assembly protein PilA